MHSNISNLFQKRYFSRIKKYSIHKKILRK